MRLRQGAVGLSLALAAAAATPAQAQNSFERAVISFLEVQHPYEDYQREGQADWLGELRRADQNRQISVTLNLEAGTTYRVVGACDTDCSNMDLEVFAPDGSMAGNDVAYDDHPFVEITPETSGAYRVHPWVVACNARPCYGGVRLLELQPRMRSGTAFLITADGYLLTAAHVVERREIITVITPTGEVPARVLVRDPANDVALLRAELTGTPLFLASAGAVARGQEVMTLGYPLVEMQGETQKATFGRINALSGLEDDIRYMQMDVTVQPGNSGGPLLSADGRAIGIVTGSINQRTVAEAADTVAQNVNYALKIDYALPMLPPEARPPAIAPLAAAGFEETAARSEPSVFRITAE